MQMAYSSVGFARGYSAPQSPGGRPRKNRIQKERRFQVQSQMIVPPSPTAGVPPPGHKLCARTAVASPPAAAEAPSRTVAPVEGGLVFMGDCPQLSLHWKHLERRGFHLTPVVSPDCRVLVLCAEHLNLHDRAVAAMSEPKLVLGGEPPSHWSNAEALAGPVLPAVLERRLTQLLGNRPSTEGARYRLLMIEDDPTVRQAATAAFEDAGFEVRSVDGFALVQEEMKRHPDFILMDLNLPGLSGEKLGEILHRQNVPIAVFSAESTARLEAARERIGAVAAYSKGMSLHHIAQQVRKYLTEAKG